MIKYKYVTFTYSMQLLDGCYINLDPSMFEDYMDVWGDFLYTNKQELAERLHYAVDESFQS